ncbi:MAG: ribonuclease III [Caulobacteraceae bacterium]
MNTRRAAVAGLEANLGHVFTDPALLERALTHASAGDANGKWEDNERLEFLGDRVLGLVVAEALVERDGAVGAGDLSKRLHALVNGEVCAAAARAADVGPALRLAGGETRRGGRDNASILANACEAIIAALYLEGGIDLARSVVMRLWAPFFAAPLDPLVANPKSELQEWAAARGRSPPVYRLLERKGPEHRPAFTVEVAVADAPPAAAEAGSLRSAEKAAALTLLRRLRAIG